MRVMFVLCSTVILGLCGCRAAAMHVQIDDDMREAMLRELFESVPDYCTTLFVQVGGGDPSPQLLARFADYPLPVKAASQARIGHLGNTGVWDKETGKVGALVSIEDKLTKTSVVCSNTVTIRNGEVALEREEAWCVVGGYYVSGICAGWRTFTFVRRNGALVLAEADAGPLILS